MSALTETPIRTTHQAPELVFQPRQLQIQELQFLHAMGSVDGDTVRIKYSPKLYKLKTPITVETSQIISLGHRGLAEFIIKGLSSHQPALIPFVLRNDSLVGMARYFLRDRSGSTKSLYTYCNTVLAYSRRMGYQPDQIIADIKPHGITDQVRLEKHRTFLKDCLAELQDRGRTPGRVCNYSKMICTFYRCSDIELRMANIPSPRPVYRDRAPTQEEIAKLLDIATLREKVIISLTALGAFREETLCRLTYGDVRQELQGGKVPMHIFVPASIVKGRYTSHDTFVGLEGVSFLRFYFDARERGHLHHIRPEVLSDNSLLIRDETPDYGAADQARPIGPKQVYKMIHELYFKANLLKPGQAHYSLRVHSLRKYFKTNLVAAGIPESYVDFWMGHLRDTYNTIESKGVEFQRDLYAKAGLNLRPKIQQTAYDILAALAKQLGKDPEKVLVRDSFSEAHRTVIDGNYTEQDYARIILERIRALASS